MAKENNSLLIFDFDNTITNKHMHNAFSKEHKSDFNSGAEYAVTDNDIKGFMKEKGGIKNEETLKSVLQSALSSGMEVNIASYTKYPNAVKRVVENHLDLSKKQAGGISVFGGFPADYDTQLPRSNVKEQQNQVGKNLHICRAIVEYKNKHNGQLPKTVMLVDDSTDNIKKIDEFVESMGKREGWLKENGLSIEDIQKIKFEGVQVPKEDKNVGYLERIQEFISANLVQESIHENLKKEDPIYHQGIHGSSSEKELSPPLPPKKRKSSDGIVVDGENKKQDIKDMSSSETQAKPTRSRRHAMILDPQQVKSALQNTEESSPGEKYAHTQTFSLLREIRSIKIFFTGCAKEIIDAVCNLFKREVVTKLKGQDYAVSSEQGNDDIIVSSNKPIYASKIRRDVVNESLGQILENTEKIKNLGNNYKGNQLEQEISKLLNADLQKENISPNSVGVNHEEPIFQSLEELGYHSQQKKGIDSNSVRGNYNDGEPIFQTREEALRGDSQKKNANLSRRPLPSLPPKSCMEEVRAEGKTKAIEK
ncbi:MAG: hypothetical protein PG978_000453 [Wolbachia endosymbiont of Ctenocephalides felis wCfeF]|nr:MAG: hypothetical protein PG978_000453 [Wolbachia endosymbiont of Ctenocephalides felis wCfeF]